VNSLIYYNFPEINEIEEGKKILPVDSSHIPEPITNDNDFDISDRIKKQEIPGDYKNFAFFSGGGTEAGNDLIYEPEYPNDPENNDTSRFPNTVEWVPYEEIQYGDHIPKELYWRALSNVPLTWPSTANVWHKMRERNFPHEPSKMFSPVFTEDWEISGRVYYLTYIQTNQEVSFSEYITITLKFSLHLFNTATNSSELEITSTSFVIPVNYTLTQRTFYSDISSPVDIPAGYRLKYDIEYKFSSIPARGSLLMYTGYPAGGAGSMTWNIVDGSHPEHENTYNLYNNQRMAGIQLYLRKKAYPDINVYGASNNTVYDMAKNINIDVTDGSISSYRWNGGGWNSFDNDTQTQLPATHGWHYLEIKASDPVFNNTRVVLYKFGYDASSDNILLHNAISGDYLAGGYVLNFSVYDVDSVEYEWDNNDSWYSLTSPYDIGTPLFAGWHNLRINTTDFYETNSYLYTFFFDSDTPVITLTNAANNSIYVPGKYLEFLITDNTGLVSLNYSWDSGTLQSWIPDPGETYSTNLPDVGSHYLEIFVIDGYGHSAYAYYAFFSDNDFFNVDLLNLIENGYYQGNETVELIVQRSNGTCYFKWDSGTEKLGTLVGTYLTLNETDALPTSQGLHTLYIRTFNLTHYEHLFNFSFYVDNTAPAISNLQSYDGGRYLNTQDFIINIIDNFADNSTELVVEYSLDGKIYQPLEYDFTFSYPYTDGPHTLDIRAQDLAGNIGNYTISFIIDSTAPSIDVTINGLIDRTGVDGNLYVPPDSDIEILVTDTDPIYTLEYNWNSTGWTSIAGDSFTLSSLIDGEGTLLIRAYDSLLNEDPPYTIILVYDSSPPDVTMTFPTTIFRINNETIFNFVASDYTLKNIDYIRYHWDETVLLANTTVSIDAVGEFDISLGTSYLILYNAFGYSLANLTVIAEDILGNHYPYVFNFTIDTTPPTAALEYFNGTHYEPLEEGVQPYLVPGGTLIRYDNSTCDDLLSINYLWIINDIPGDWTPLTADDNWEFNLESEDGNHTLIILLKDNTGQGTSPNVKNATFDFIVNDMLITALYPIGFEDGYHHSMVYNDTFIFGVNVTDEVDDEPIPGLIYGYNYDPSLNLNITIVKFDISSFEIIIHGTDVTDSEETLIRITFTRAGGGVDTIGFFLRIDKKEGVLNLIEPDSQITYEENLELSVYLQNDLSENQTITRVFVNDSLTLILREIHNFIYNPSTNICTFNFSSYWIGMKGNFSIDIFTESNYYYANTTTGTTVDIEILPLPIVITISVSNYTILEGTDVSIIVTLTYLNGTPVNFAPITLFVHVYLKSITQESLSFLFEDANSTLTYPLSTGSQGTASMLFTLTDEMAYIALEASYDGTPTQDSASFILQDVIITFPPPEPEVFPKWLMYTIIGGSIALVAIISFIIYKLTRPKPFEALMEKITDEEIATYYSIMSPGVILSIFDQRKGPIPLVEDHSLSIARYRNRIAIGIENFLLKISDQAYSSLGFEEHTDERRTGSIRLPREQMIGMIHGVQLENKAARGGFENLSLIVLADNEYGNLLLSYQDFLYDDIDRLISKLKTKKPLSEVQESLSEVRRKSVIVMLAAQEYEQAQNGK
jgi:hypothetical protein